MRLGLLLLVAAIQLGAAVQALPALPNGAIANAVQVDAAGNIYVAGEYFPNPQDPNAPGHAIVGKLSSDGLRVIWWTILAGSKDDRVLAMALGADNSVYVTGNTSSTDFPTTAGSLQPTSTGASAFAAKLSPAGAVAYSTYIGGSVGTTGNAIAVDTSGDAFITGALYGSLATTPGAITGDANPVYNTAYVIELNPAGSSALVAIAGFGGDAITVDAQGNIYAAGAFAFPNAPTTAGAFQSSVSLTTCTYAGMLGSFPCAYQHVAKINPAGTKLIYATYLAGTWGAAPTGIAVDAAGNAILAGTTNSPDYPTTPGAYQPEYFANPQTQLAGKDSSAPPSAGFVTKLNATGTGLLWSTFLAGSGSTRPGVITIGDSIAGMAVDAAGNILVAGLAHSNDLPGLWLTPVASRPTFANPSNFVARLSADGSTLSPVELLPSSTGLGGIAVRTDGSAVFGSPISIATLSTVGRVAAISDTADNAKIVRVAPGQLLTLYGTTLAPTGPASGFPTSLNGVTVTFNGIAAPILYTSGIQIDVQVPYEISGSSQVTLQLSSQLVTPPVSESYLLAVVERQPSVFLSDAAFSQPTFDVAACNGQSVSGSQPLALNADGTQNSCANPSASGSAVTIFLNGLGISNPAQLTGTISRSLVPISPSAAFVYPSATASTNFLSTATLPGSIASLAQVQIQVTSTSPVVNIPLQVQQASESPFLVRGPGVLIWVHQ